MALANGINRVAESVKATIKQQREHQEKIAVSLEALRKAASSKIIDHNALENSVLKIGEELGKASGELDKYKV